MTPLRSLTRNELLKIADNIMVRCHLLSCCRDGMKDEEHQMHVRALWEVGQMLKERLRGELVEEQNAEFDRAHAIRDAASLMNDPAAADRARQKLIDQAFDHAKAWNEMMNADKFPEMPPATPPATPPVQWTDLPPA